MKKTILINICLFVVFSMIFTSCSLSLFVQKEGISYQENLKQNDSTTVHDNQVITYFTGRSSVGLPPCSNDASNNTNSPPIIAANSPANESLWLSLTPQTNITIFDPDGDNMTVQWMNNNTGDWQTYGINTSVTDGVYRQSATWATTNQKTYWWYVEVSDGKNVTTAVYCFTISTIETVVDQIVPYNTTTNPITINITGSYDLNNVTLFYRYNTVNSTSRYLTDITEKEIFRNRVDSTVFDYPNDIDMINGIGYIVSCNNNSLVIINATDESHLVQTAYKQDYTYLRTAHGIAVTSDRKYAYTITCRTNSYICMWDVTNIYETPIRLNQIYLPSEAGMYLEISGNYLILTTKSKIHIYDITYRNWTHAMIEVSNFSYSTVNSSTYYWHSLVIDNFLYVTSAYGSTRGGFVIFNITNKEYPTEVRRVNDTINFIELRQYYYRGFHYLISACKEKPTTFYKGYIYVYNISSGTVDNPTFLFRKCTNHNSSWFASGAFSIINGYIFCEQKNYNNSVHSGIEVWNLTDINIPSYVTSIYGNGEPHYLNLCHDVEFDLNESDGILYILTQTDDSFVTFDLSWLGTPGPFWSAWTTFETPDSTYPWSFSFTFPNDTGYYEFYSIGQKSGLPPETPPSEKDAMVQYTNLAPKANYAYSPEHPTIDDIIQFSDTSITPYGWVVNWSWDFGDETHSFTKNPSHQYTHVGNYSVTLSITDNRNAQNTTTKIVEVKKPMMFIQHFIFGRITNLGTVGEYINFNAIKLRVIGFRPFSFSVFTHGEYITILKDYTGVIKPRFIFAMCKMSIETERTINFLNNSFRFHKVILF